MYMKVPHKIPVPQKRGFDKGQIMVYSFELIVLKSQNYLKDRLNTRSFRTFEVNGERFLNCTQYRPPYMKPHLLLTQAKAPQLKIFPAGYPVS